MLTAPSPTHHQSGSWPGVFGWFCGWWMVFSSICFFWSISVYPAGRQQASPKHVWAVALLESDGSRETQDMQRCSVPCTHPSGTPGAWKHPPSGFPHTEASYSSLNDATAVQCQVGINRSHDLKSYAQWFSPTAIRAHRVAPPEQSPQKPSLYEPKEIFPLGHKSLGTPRSLSELCLSGVFQRHVSQIPVGFPSSHAGIWNPFQAAVGSIQRWLLLGSKNGTPWHIAVPWVPSPTIEPRCACMAN